MLPTCARRRRRHSPQVASRWPMAVARVNCTRPRSPCSPTRWKRAKACRGWHWPRSRKRRCMRVRAARCRRGSPCAWRATWMRRRRASMRSRSRCALTMPRRPGSAPCLPKRKPHTPRDGCRMASMPRCRCTSACWPCNRATSGRQKVAKMRCPTCCSRFPACWRAATWPARHRACRWPNVSMPVMSSCPNCVPVLPRPCNDAARASANPCSVASMPRPPRHAWPCARSLYRRHRTSATPQW